MRELEFLPEDYLRAAREYRRVLRAGEASAVVLNNLGDAWLKAGRTGAAVAAYSRAMRYAPGEPHIAANLAYARSKTPAAAAPPAGGVLDVLFFWNRHARVDAVAWTAAGLVAAAAMLGALGLFGVKFPLRRAVMAVLAAAAGILYLSAWRQVAEFSAPRAVVVAAGAQVYSGDSEQARPVFQRPLPEGTGQREQLC